VHPPSAVGVRFGQDRIAGRRRVGSLSSSLFPSPISLLLSPMHILSLSPPFARSLSLSLARARARYDGSLSATATSRHALLHASLRITPLGSGGDDSLSPRSSFSLGSRNACDASNLACSSLSFVSKLQRIPERERERERERVRSRRRADMTLKDARASFALPRTIYAKQLNEFTNDICLSVLGIWIIRAIRPFGQVQINSPYPNNVTLRNSLV